VWIVLAAVAVLGGALAALAAYTLSARDETRPYGIASGGSFERREPAELARELDGYGALGVEWIRFDAKWREIEATKDSYEWSELDTAVNHSIARGLNVQLVLAYSPPWANGEQGDKVPPTDAHFAEYAEFAGDVVARYRPKGVRAYEVWNEPNLGCCFWRPRAEPERYARLLAQAYETMKARAPDITVLGMALSGATDDETNMTPNTFTQRAYAAGAKLDALSVHPYLGVSNDPTFEWEHWQYAGTGSWFGSCPSVRCTMVENGDGGKKIWATEVGQPQLDLAPSAVPRIFDKWRSYDFTGPAFWYTYRDSDAHSLVDPATWERRPAWFRLRDHIAAAGS
jgi:polysaccharide biosynthesis protein PslG